MANPPIHVEQLDGSSQAGANCGMAAAAMAVNFATQGQTKPTPTQMRTRAATGNGSTNTADQQKAVQSYNTPGETGNRKPLVYKRMLQRPWSELVEAIDKGYCVNLQISYAVFNKESSVTGDPNFTGMHSITVHGKRLTSSKLLQYKDYDPLFDGRRSGIANGPTWVAAADLKKAAERFAGKSGCWTGGIIKVSPKLAAPDKPVVPPEPTPKPPVVVDKAAIYLDALTKTRSALLDALAIINGALPEQVNTFQFVEPGTMDAIAEAAIPVENEPDEPDEPDEGSPPDEGDE